MTFASFALRFGASTLLGLTAVLAPALPAAAQQAPAVGSAPAPAAAAAPKASPNEVVARVNAREITVADIGRVVRVAREVGASSNPGPDEIRRVLDGLIEREILAELVAKENLPVSEDEIDSGLADVRKSFRSEQEMTAALAQENLTMDLLKSRMREQVAMKKYLDGVRDKITVSDEEIKKAYDDLNEKGRTKRDKETVRVGHFFVNVPQDSEESVWDAAKTKAEDAYKRVTEGKEAFEKVVAEMSDDKGPDEKGAPYEEIPRGRMPSRLDKTIFETQAGQVSTPIRMDNGYHFVKVYAHFDAGTSAKLEDIAGELRRMVAEDKTRKQISETVKAARPNMKIEILYKDDATAAKPAGSASAAPAGSATPDADLLQNESL